jgi:divinyl chlorophyllide a 8-vinyl-reductase
MSALKSSSRPKRIFLLGATGTIGRATAHALHARGYHVVCFVRDRAKARPLLPGIELREGRVTDPASLEKDGFRGEPFDALVSCLASRTGVTRDAWAIDHRAHVEALQAAKKVGVKQVVLLSAICVQKPLLAFQKAKLAFEAELIASGVTYSIVRPTAFFKSLSGQVARVLAGKPYIHFGDGKMTACKPISDDDLGSFIADCLTDETRWNKILPIGGPGPALTPREQGALIFEATGREPKYQKMPIGILSFIRGCLAVLGLFSRKLADKAELASIGLYYARESMLVLDPATGRYNADATPSFGTHTLADHYKRMVQGKAADDRGDHAVF